VSIEEQVGQVDLDYSLAIDEGGTSATGIYAYSSRTGARVVIDDLDGSELAYVLSAAECTRLAHYLLACAKAAGS
jgi:hypothetical protein